MHDDDPTARLAAENAVLREALFALTTAYLSPLWVRRRAWSGIQDADRVRGGAVPPDNSVCLAAWQDVGGEGGAS